MAVKVSIPFLNRTLSLESGRIARQAHGAVWLQHGSLVILATAVSPYDRREEVDYFPLNVDYRERYTAVGRFPGGYIKREGRPTDKEILTARCIDRPLRPLFPSDYFNEVQIIVQVMSADPTEDPDTMAVVAASAAIAASDIPINALIGAVRVAKIDGQLRINPSHEERERATLDFVVAGTREKVIMIEGMARQAPEAEVHEAIMVAQRELQPLITLQEELARELGVQKRTYTPVRPCERCQAAVANVRDEIAAALRITGKTERNTALAGIKERVRAALAAEEGAAPVDPMGLNIAFDEMVGACMREMILKEHRRVDGRGLDELRPITCEVGLLPRTHGSALFIRGETQSVGVTTLGTAEDEQEIELLQGETTKKFMLHYSFPPYSVGEAKPMRGPGRREIGHGDLAERSLRPVVPEDFIYTIRVTSDITESNGSSSMASVCSGCLSLMDAGVPISAPVAGISIGLIEEGEERVLLTDIVGDEDHYGDMDFKVAGTAQGVTGIQVDLKIAGLPPEFIGTILERAREARLKILEIMKATLPAPRPEVSPYAPAIITIRIPVDKIGTLIGPSGKNVRRIQEETKTTITIEDDGTVQIAGETQAAAEAGRAMIEEWVAEAQIGKIYEGPVTRIMSFGAFVKILPECEGMVHISEIADRRIDKIEDVLKVGDIVKVRVIEIDEKGRVNLSMRNLDKPFEAGAVLERGSERRSEGRSETRHERSTRPEHGSHTERSGHGQRRDHSERSERHGRDHHDRSQRHSGRR